MQHRELRSLYYNFHSCRFKIFLKKILIRFLRWWLFRVVSKVWIKKLEFWLKLNDRCLHFLYLFILWHIVFVFLFSQVFFRNRCNCSINDWTCRTLPVNTGTRLTIASLAMMMWGCAHVHSSLVLRRCGGCLIRAPPCVCLSDGYLQLPYVCLEQRTLPLVSPTPTCTQGSSAGYPRMGTLSQASLPLSKLAAYE